MQEAYIQGETIKFAVSDGGYTAASVQIGAASAVAMTLADGVWSASVSSADMAGVVRYAVFATVDGEKKAVETGAFTVRPLRSKYWAVVEAIDAALQGVAANGKYSITVGEISLQDKTFDEMIKFEEYYRGLAEQDETGMTSIGRVSTIQARF